MQLYNPGDAKCRHEPLIQDCQNKCMQLENMCSVKTFMLLNDILEMYIVFQLSKGTLVIYITAILKELKRSV